MRVAAGCSSSSAAEGPGTLLLMLPLLTCLLLCYRISDEDGGMYL